MEFEAKPEIGDGMGAALKAALPDTRAFDGCVKLDVLRSTENPNVWTLVEEWKSKAHHAKYAQWRTETGFMDKMMSTVVAPPKQTWHQSFDA